MRAMMEGVPCPEKRTAHMITPAKNGRHIVLVDVRRKTEPCQLNYPNANDHCLSANECNRRTDKSKYRYEKNKKENAQTRSDTSTDEKTLLLVKCREKVLEKSRKKEWDQAQAEKLHGWNGRQIFFSQRQSKDWFGPRHEKSGQRNTDEQQKT